MRSAFAFAFAFTFAIAAVVLAVPASAAPDAAGATLDDVEAALNEGLQVERDRSDPAFQFLLARGRNHTIAVHMIHCGTGSRCEGVRYFAILKNKPSPTFLNAFNDKFTYAKVSIDEDDDGIITVEHQVAGGVTSGNLLEAALILMVRMSDYATAANQVVSANGRFPTGQTRMLSAAIGEHILPAPRMRAAGPAFDPALVKKLKANVRAY